MSASEGSASRFWETAVASTAVLVAVLFLVGYEHAAANLFLSFGFFGPILSVYSYDDLLVRGASVMLTLVAPTSLLPCTLALVAFQLVRRRTAGIWLGRALALGVVLFAVLIPFGGGATWSLTFRHPRATLSVLVASLVFCTALVVSGRPLLPIAPWLRAAAITSGWLFALWLVPPVLLWMHPPCYSEAYVEYRDGREAETLAYVNRLDGAFVLGDVTKRLLRIISPDTVLQVSITYKCASPWYGAVTGQLPH
jgi:hypothetical protein